MDDEAKQAAALQYRQGQDAAPRVVAAGKGAVAERIIKEGEQHGVPVYKDPDLARLLAALPLGAEIPSDLYARGGRGSGLCLPSLPPQDGDRPALTSVISRIPLFLDRQSPFL